MTEIDEFVFAIDLTFRNEWRNIDLLSTSVQNCFLAVFADVDGCHTIAMVTGELLENALKYGDWVAGDRAMFRLRVGSNEGDVEVSVQSPVKQNDSSATSLLEQVTWIESFGDPAQAYRARMLAIANDEQDVAPSRLGLVRIAFEGNCRLSAIVEHDAVTVTARFVPDRV